MRPADQQQGPTVGRGRSTGGTLDRWNTMPRPDLVRELLLVCHSHRWADRVADSRPFADRGQVVEAADRIWLDLDAADWLEALEGHPRIGESGGASKDHSTAEQAQVANADDQVRAAIAAGNQTYESRFGHVFLISAQGRSPQEILDNLQSRLHNDADTEVRVAAQEHRRITALRLERTLG